jgi:hypothetical protein
MIDWRGHGSGCPCERCAAFRTPTGRVLALLVCAFVFALLAYGLRRLL